jgi:hypothetical protein
VTYFSHRPAIGGGKRTIDCFGHKSKLPLLTDRIQSNCRTFSACAASAISHILVTHSKERGDKGEKIFGFQNKVPFFTVRF